MSAIWGAIDFTNNEISEKVKTIFRNCFSECVIDRSSDISDVGVYFGCGIQYITSESRYESLPAGEENTFFTADVILDNRDELCSALSIENKNDLPDGKILFETYNAFGNKSLTMMRGAYTFVKYNKQTKTVKIVSDAVGNRFVYYMLQDGILYFSSLMKPLEQIAQKKHINSLWLSDFLANDGLSVFETCEDTSVAEINRIAPATEITIVDGKIASKYLYWDVSKLKSGKRTKSDEEYKKEFVNLYRSCVRDVLRSSGETAIFLSSGYDSTSVACLAAPILKERGKRLYSFTSAPDVNYVSDCKKYEIDDETELVKKTASFLGNVEPEFIRLQDVNLWDERKEYMKVCEIPYKSPQNMLWLYEGHRLAYKKGARIILSGAFGNGTVSFDNCSQYLTWLVRTCRFSTFWNEINVLQQKYGASRKRIIFKTLMSAVNISSGMKKKKAFQYSYIDGTFLKSSGAVERAIKRERNFKKSYNDPGRYHSLFLPIENFRHYGDFAQKNSLYSGVILRDQTKDIRMVEFVMTIPYDQFFHNGYSRRLIREYCEDIMPADYFKRHPFGVQSADTKYRFVRDSNAILKEWRSLSDLMDGKNVIDLYKIKKDLKNKNIEDWKNFDIIRMFYTMNLLEYIQNYEM